MCHLAGTAPTDAHRQNVLGQNEAALYLHTGKMAFRRRGSFAKTLRSVEPEFSDFEADGGITAAAKNQWYFEIAWEVANKGKPVALRRMYTPPFACLLRPLNDCGCVQRKHRGV